LARRCAKRSGYDTGLPIFGVSLLRLFLIAALAAAAIAACGGSAGAGAGTSNGSSVRPAIAAGSTINPQEVAAAITSSATSERHATPTVVCPAGVPLATGEQFYCVAEVGSQVTPFKVTETSDTGAVRYVGVSAKSVPVINAVKVARSIRESIRSERKITATVACPSGIPRQQGLQFVCTATTTAAQTKRPGVTDFVVTEQNSRGFVSYQAG
jgi:hypothetical protein